MSYSRPSLKIIAMLWSNYFWCLVNDPKYKLLKTTLPRLLLQLRSTSALSGGLRLLQREELSSSVCLNVYNCSAAWWEYWSTFCGAVLCPSGCSMLNPLSSEEVPTSNSYFCCWMWSSPPGWAPTSSSSSTPSWPASTATSTPASVSSRWAAGTPSGMSPI